MSVRAMNLTEIAFGYGVSVKTVRKWIHTYLPELKRPPGSYIYTPEQIKKIIEGVGEFKE